MFSRAPSLTPVGTWRVCRNLGEENNIKTRDSLSLLSSSKSWISLSSQIPVAAVSPGVQGVCCTGQSPAFEDKWRMLSSEMSLVFPYIKNRK